MDIDANNNNNEPEKMDGIKSELPAVAAQQMTLETLDMERFLMILDYLDSDSLMELCAVNDNFRSNICSYKHILASKLFKIDEFEDLMPSFTNFGQYIHKLDVNEYNLIHDKFVKKFNRMLDAIIVHLRPGHLTELSISFGIVNIDRELVQSALPYFSNLNFFCFSACGSYEFSRSQEYFLDEVIGNARQLKSLDVRHLRTAGSWYRFEHLVNLEHLTFIFIDLIKFAEFGQFIQKRPSLKTMVVSIDSVHRQHLCKLVFEHLPNLKQFEIRNSYMDLPNGDDFDFSPVPWRRSNRTTGQEQDDNGGQQEAEEEEMENGDGGADDENSEDDDDASETEDGETTDSGDESDLDTVDSDSDIDEVRDTTFNNDHINNWKRIYAGLSRMNYLKRTWLKSHFSDCSDLYDVLKTMAHKNTIEHLTIQVSELKHEFAQNDDFMAKQFPLGFTALKTLRIVSPSDNTQPFLHHFISALPNLTKCVLDMEETHRSVQDTIANLVASAKVLDVLVLKLPPMNLDYLLYMKLAGIQYCKALPSAQTKPLYIYFNSHQQLKKCRDKLQEYYDEKIIAIKVRSFCDWETNPETNPV